MTAPSLQTRDSFILNWFVKAVLQIVKFSTGNHNYRLVVNKQYAHREN